MSFKNRIDCKRLFVFLIFLFANITVQAQFREEMATLESMYEARARSVINTVLHPQDYSIVVAVDIDRDMARLEKIQQEFEKDLLPGMPGGLNSENPAIANQLYEIKNKIDLHLILSPKVSKEKEDTVSALLKMKLHLDDKNGDTLAISRAELPMGVPEPVSSKLPELSWKMWGMLTALLLLAFSGLFFYLSKKQSKEAVDEKEPGKLEAPEAMIPKTETKATDDVTTIPPIDPNEVMYEQKKQILSLSQKYPEATAQALSDHFQRGHEKDLLLMCEAFGWETSKKIFAGLSPRIWGRMGHLVLTKQNQASVSEMTMALENCGKTILKKFLEIGSQDTKNPFSYIWKLDSYDLKKLLDGEAADNIALICVHGNKEQVFGLMESLEPVMQEAATIAISRLNAYTELQVKTLNEKLSQKLKFINENPETQANGVELVADLLRTMPAEKEYPFFEKIMSENPTDAEKIRRTILLYPDIAFVPEDIISEMSALLEMSVIVTALRKNFPETREHILKALPPKKSMMIRRDLEVDVLISDKQVAMSQRELVKTISALLKAKNIEMFQLLGETGYSDSRGDQTMERMKAG